MTIITAHPNNNTLYDHNITYDIYYYSIHLQLNYITFILPLYYLL